MGSRLLRRREFKSLTSQTFLLVDFASYHDTVYRYVGRSIRRNPAFYRVAYEYRFDSRLSAKSATTYSSEDKVCSLSPSSQHLRVALLKAQCKDHCNESTAKRMLKKWQCVCQQLAHLRSRGRVTLRPTPLLDVFGPSTLKSTPDPKGNGFSLLTLILRTVVRFLRWICLSGD